MNWCLPSSAKITCHSMRGEICCVGWWHLCQHGFCPKICVLQYVCKPVSLFLGEMKSFSGCRPTFLDNSRSLIGFLLHLSWPMFVSEKHSHCEKLCRRQPVCPAWIPLVLQLLRLVPLHFPVDFSPQTTEVWWRTMSKTEKHQPNRTLRSSKGKLMSAYEVCRNFSTSNQILKSSVPS